jgi:nitrogenase molybdenum-iron protein alpha/beta subunit
VSRPFNNQHICFICRRRAGCNGVGKPGRQGWACDACGILLAKRAIRMSEEAFDEFEIRAIDAAGDEAGSYLDDIGKTDLADLTPDEWRHFLRTFLRAVGSCIRREVEKGTPPF